LANVLFDVILPSVFGSSSFVCDQTNLVFEL
jgi:hypothetical protein